MEAIKLATQPAVRLHAEKAAFDYPLVSPVATNENIMIAWRNFQDLKLKLLDQNDFVEVRGEKLAKKSAFRKLAFAFGISTELVREERIQSDGADAYLITMKATAPSGRSMDAVASCHGNERKFTKPSDVRATAETRATSRAIASLIGWSAPSAEEVVAEDEPVGQPSQATQMQPIDGSMTASQRKLLIQLIVQRTPDPEERENALGVIEGLSKADASALISDMLKQNAT